MQPPESWLPLLREELAKPYIPKLEEFLVAERATSTVFPPEDEVFSALAHTPPEKVSVVLLGQDPYHGEQQAHGMAFSVRPGIKPPPSLVNIYKELQSDLGCQVPNHGHLVPWADQGVLLLNTVLTVRAHEPNSHRGKGWEKLTDAIIRKVAGQAEPVVFLLWGAPAQKKTALIDTTRHVVLQAAHPSPLSAHKGFLGSRIFSRTNEALKAAGRPEIDWQLQDL